MDFIILKVNGVDVSGSQEAAFAQLSTADEPIIVEVRRKKISELSEVEKMREETENCTLPAGGGVDIIPDLEYEEVVLVRSGADERLGLTLCYEAEDHLGRTEIFVDDIHPAGLAERDGRLRLGDQIIQIDGDTMWSKLQAQDKFRQSRGTIRLLVVRPPSTAVRSSSCSSFQRKDEYEQDLDLLLEQKLRSLDSGNSSLESGDRSFDSDKKLEISDRSFDSEKSKNRLSSSSSKDSGHKSDSIDRSTTNSSKSDSSQLSEMSDPLNQSFLGLKHSQSMFSIDDDFIFVNSKKNIDFNRNSIAKPSFSTEMNRKGKIDPIYEMIPEQSETDETYCLPLDNVNKSNKNSLISNKNTKNGLMMNKNCSPEHTAGKTRSKSSDKIRDILRPKPGDKPIPRSVSLNKYENRFIADQQQQQEQLNQEQEVKKQEEIENWIRSYCRKSSEARLAGKSPMNTPLINTQRRPMSESTLSLVMSTADPSASYFTADPLRTADSAYGNLYINPTSEQYISPDQCSDIVYTDLNNVQYIIQQQQQQLLNKLNKPVFNAPPPPPGRFPPACDRVPPILDPRTNSGEHHEQSTSFMGSGREDENWEWKVKIRPDGTRYVTRRPLRKHRLLQERARQVAAERAANTTDDDTTSELKFGKFWTKQERKQHLEVAKERRLKREEKLKMRQDVETGSAEKLRETGSGGKLRETGSEEKKRETGSAETVTRRESTKTAESMDRKRFSLQEENMRAAQHEILVSVMTV